MCEKIVRHIEHGMRPFGRPEGARRDRLYHHSITFSWIAVFIPVLLMVASSAACSRIRAVTVSVARYRVRIFRVG